MRIFSLENIYSYNYNYLPLWLIGFLINILRWSEIVITGILIFEITSSPFQVTLLLILRFLSLMSFSVFSGIIVDKYNKKYCLSISLFLIAIISILFYSFTKQNINIYILHLYSVLSGGFWAMESTARKALIIESIKVDFYAKYISLDTLSLHITRCIGPLLSGFFYNYITISYLFLLSFSTYIICFTLSIYIENNKNPSSTSIISIYDYKLIYKKIINEKYLVLIYLITITFNIWAYAHISLLPAVVDIDDFYESSHISYLFAIEALGSLFSILFIYIFDKQKLYNVYYIAGTVITLLSALIFCFSFNIYFTLIILFIGGFGSGLFSAMQPILVALYSPPDYKGTMLGCLNLCIGFATIGYLNVGLLSTHYGVKEAILISAVEGLFILILNLFIFNKMKINILPRGKE